jgi:DNA-binding transcriptional ArsR family regulator
MSVPAIELKSELFRGLADASRLSVLEGLRDGPRNVGEVVARTGLTQSNVSMHLGCLADCGLVARERHGKFVVYRISDRRILKLLGQVDELLSEVGGFIALCARYGPPERWPARRAAGSRRWLPSARSR